MGDRLVSRFPDHVRRYMEGLPPRERLAMIVGVHVGTTGTLPAPQHMDALRRQLGVRNGEPKKRIRKPTPIEALPTLHCEDCGTVIPRPAERRRGRPPRKCDGCKAES